MSPPPRQGPWALVECPPGAAVLDAGTGDQSLEFLLGLEDSRCWTAVTACPRYLEGLRTRHGARLRPRDRLVLGSWSDPHLLAGERYDVVVAQYLLGAVERASPYFEHRLLARLRPLVAGRLCVVGLEPPLRPATPADRLVSDLQRYRDSVLVLTGGRGYREYPLAWVLENLASSGYRVLDRRVFPNVHGADEVRRMVDSAQAELRHLPDADLRRELHGYGERLRRQGLELVSREGPAPSGFDYLVVAEPG